MTHGLFQIGKLVDCVNVDRIGKRFDDQFLKTLYHRAIIVKFLAVEIITEYFEWILMRLPKSSACYQRPAREVFLYIYLIEIFDIMRSCPQTSFSLHPAVTSAHTISSETFT